MALPAPTVPSLSAENWIDLDQLGNRALATYINYPGIRDGDYVFPNWRGCGAQGQVEDVAEVRLRVTAPDSEGFLLEIDNAQLRNLDQGWVFYSFLLPDPNDPNKQGEESLRLFFYVGARESSGTATQLPVAQVRESHELEIALSDIAGSEASVIVAPYQAMSLGDTVTLTIEFYYEEMLEETLTVRKILTADELSRPLRWPVAKNKLQIFVDGFVRVSYSIDYAAPTRTTQSPVQQLAVVRSSAAPRLPAPTIDGFSGDQLDPEAYPQGIVVRVPCWPGALAGDVLLLHAAVSGRDLRVEALTLDVTSVDSGVLTLRLDHAWLMDSHGLGASLSWQYARQGASGSSESLALVVRRPLKLPPPSVEGSVDEDPVDGVPHAYLVASHYIADDVYANIPADADFAPQDQPQMHWLGHRNGSVVIAHPTLADPRRFQVPSRVLAANMNKRVEVFYQVTPTPDQSVESARLSLAIHPIASGWPAIQLRDPPYTHPVRLRDVPASGALFCLPPWAFRAEGQRVRIRADSLDQQGQPLSEIMRDDLPVTAPEYATPELWATLSRGFLERHLLDSTFTIRVHVSFDDGDSWVAFQDVAIQLAA